jgi:membrane protein YdbS with pleckstrin-like domain
MVEDDAANQRVETQLRVMRIIAAALMMGLSVFLALAIFLVQQRQPRPDQPIVISYLAVGFFAVILVLWWVIPDRAIKPAISQLAARGPGNDLTDTSSLLPLYQTRNIIACALLEGAAFFGCITYIVEGQVFALAIPAVVLALMVLTFPTRDRVSQWVEEQQRRINDLRS